MAKEDNLIPFKPGQSGNPNGRPKKMVTLLKESGYKLSEINDTIQVMIAMNLDELKDVWDNKDATTLEKIVASALKKSIEKGSLYSLETLLSRVYGMPNQKTDNTNINTNIEIKAEFGSKIIQPPSEPEVNP